jgi:hypothetical protein
MFIHLNLYDTNAINVVSVVQSFLDFEIRLCDSCEGRSSVARDIVSTRTVSGIYKMLGMGRIALSTLTLQPLNNNARTHLPLGTLFPLLYKMIRLLCYPTACNQTCLQDTRK